MVNTEKGVGGTRTTFQEVTANDRFKRSFSTLFWMSMIAATVAHFALMRFFPKLTAADLSFKVNELKAVDLPPEVEIPPPPDQIQRPAMPVVAQTDLDEDITIAPTTFEDNPVEGLPPPPSQASRLGDQPVFTPFTVAPALRDPSRAAQVVREEFPDILRRAGMGGTVTVWAFIDDQGGVKKAEVNRTSGNNMLDDAAVAAVLRFAFRPAMNRDTHVPVWVSIPITFRLDH